MASDSPAADWTPGPDARAAARTDRASADSHPARGTGGDRRAAPRPTTVLVVVHADSACGSADYNLGRQQGACEREWLIGDLESWTGPVVVLDGGFTDEYTWPRYQRLGASLDALVARCAVAGHVAVRLSAPDPEHMDAIRSLATTQRWTPETTRFEITGCWVNARNPDDGCVGSTAAALRALGFAAMILGSAVREPAEEPVEEHDEDEREDEARGT